MPSSFSSTSTQATSNPAVPATPMAPTPSISIDTTTGSSRAPGLPPSNSRDTCKASNSTSKWVINLSKTPLTPEQLSLLQRGPFCHNSQVPPIEAYITAVEQASSKLPAQEANELRSDVNRLLKQPQTHCRTQCNINPIQHRALTQLKQDTSRVVHTVDKVVAMVIMDKDNYTNKANTLLQDTNTYKVLKMDPTNNLKNKLISLLKDIKQTGGLSTNKYKQPYPTSAVPPKFHGLPKIHKVGTPLGP